MAAGEPAAVAFFVPSSWRSQDKLFSHHLEVTMFSLLNRYVLVTALLIGFTRVCVAAEYAYQGADYSWVPGGTQFSLTDSTSGTLTINNPPWGGVCTGLGSGAGECDITNFELTSSGSPPLSLDFSTFGSSDTVPKLSFNADGQIDKWVLQLGDTSGCCGEDYIVVESGDPGYLIIGNGTRVDSPSTGSLSVTGYAFQTSSVWSLVPEPSTAILFSLGGLSLAGVCHRRP